MCTCLLWPSAPGVVHPFKHVASQLQKCVPLERNGEENTKGKGLWTPSSRSQNSPWFSFRYLIHKKFLTQYNIAVHYWGTMGYVCRDGSFCPVIEEIGIQKHVTWHWETETQGGHGVKNVDRYRKIDNAFDFTETARSVREILPDSGRIRVAHLNRWCFILCIERVRSGF